MLLHLFANPLVVGSLTTSILIGTGYISFVMHKILVMTTLIISAIGCIFLILAHQNVESINDSSPINMPQSSQRDSAVVKVIQSLIAVFLISCILLNRLGQVDKASHNIADKIFASDTDEKNIDTNEKTMKTVNNDHDADTNRAPAPSDSNLS